MIWIIVEALYCMFIQRNKVSTEEIDAINVEDNVNGTIRWCFDSILDHRIIPETQIHSCDLKLLKSIYWGNLITNLQPRNNQWVQGM